ncbi:MAG: TOBE domain-containing protein [Hyphomicrobiaceae bacterium]|nr:TOBE domain-containing protein [Hyphomicrobiaceae bacterium]
MSASTQRPAPQVTTTLQGRVIRHDQEWGMSVVFVGDGELRVPLIDAEIDKPVLIAIDGRDVAVALSRPMDVSITNRLPGTIVEIERLAQPYSRVRFDLGCTVLDALVTWESVDRLALEPGLRAWAMIKSVAIGPSALRPSEAPAPRAWPGR